MTKIKAKNRKRAPAVAVQRVVSVRHGTLIFRGCENHPDRSNSSCARIRFEDTNAALTTDQLWKVLQDLEAKHANSDYPTANRITKDGK